MAGPSITPTQRPLAWLLESGQEVGLISQDDPYQERGHPPHYQFFPVFEEKWRIWLANATHLTAAQKQAPDFGAAYLARRLRRIAAEFQPDVIHVHGLQLPAACCLRVGLKPLVVSAWGGLNCLLQADLAQSHPTLPRAKRIASEAAAVIVESENLAAALKSSDLSPRRVGVVPMGVNPQLFRAPTPAQRAAWRRALNFPDGATVLLSPRGWAATYCQREIIAAYLKARPHLRRPACLALCQLQRGSHAEAKTYYNKIMHDLERGGIMSEVRLVPALRFEMMASLYGAADIIINYPNQDAFPSTLIEAAACERPFLTADLPAYRGTFIARYGTLVAPNDVPALAAAMVSAVNAEPHTYQAQTVAAREVIVNEYTTAASAEKLLALYREVLNDV